jgi:ribosomal protein S18 acetylase RimI-like enzyme
MMSAVRSDAEPARLVVRAMAPADVDAVVGVHLRAFQSFFLSSLGPAFLTVLYRAMIDFDEIALVATTDDRVAGFVAGSVNPGGCYRRLLRARLMDFALAAVPAAIRNPVAAVRIVRALRKPAEGSRPPGTATLMSLAVDPGLRDQGHGTHLVRSFVAECRSRGASRVDLMTDRYGNDAVNAFYAGLGFRIGRAVTTPERRVLNEYELDLHAG